MITNNINSTQRSRQNFGMAVKFKSPEAQKEVQEYLETKSPRTIKKFNKTFERVAKEQENNPHYDVLIIGTAAPKIGINDMSLSTRLAASIVEKGSTDVKDKFTASAFRSDSHLLKGLSKKTTAQADRKTAQKQLAARPAQILEEIENAKAREHRSSVGKR